MWVHIGIHTWLHIGTHMWVHMWKISLIPQRVRRDRHQLSEILFCDHDKVIVEPFSRFNRVCIWSYQFTRSKITVKYTSGCFFFFCFRSLRSCCRYGRTRLLLLRRKRRSTTTTSVEEEGEGDRWISEFGRRGRV